MPWAPQREARSAREFVVRQVAQLSQAGSLDAGNGDVLDAYLEGLRGQWHADIASERTVRVAAAHRELTHLEAAEEAASRRDVVATAECQRTEREMAILEKRIFRPAENEPADRRERRRRPRPTLDPVEGLVPSLPHKILITVLLLLAAGGDLVTFRLTLAAFTGQADWIVWVLTIAFAAASVGLMHGAGRALKDLREARGGSGRIAIGIMLGAWVALGGVATFFRTQVASPTSGPQSAFGGDAVVEAAEASHEAILSAVLLAGLFLASGVLAFYAGFSEHHPQARAYLALRKRLDKQVRKAETVAAEAGKLGRQLEFVQAQESRIDHGAADAVAAADAIITELRELARVEMARHMGLPEATNGLTTVESATPPRPEIPRRQVVPQPRPEPSGSSVPRDTDEQLGETSEAALAGAGLWSANGHPGPGPSANGHALNGHSPSGQGPTTEPV